MALVLENGIAFTVEVVGVRRTRSILGLTKGENCTQ